MLTQRNMFLLTLTRPIPGIEIAFKVRPMRPHLFNSRWSDSLAKLAVLALNPLVAVVDLKPLYPFALKINDELKFLSKNYWWIYLNYFCVFYFSSFFKWTLVKWKLSFFVWKLCHFVTLVKWYASLNIGFCLKFTG